MNNTATTPTRAPVRIGYIRVSSVDQNTDRQLDGVEGLALSFTDHASGGSTKRPQLQALLAADWPKGSTVVVHSMDRLARSLVDLLAIVEGLNKRGISVQFIKEGRTYGDKTNPNDTLMLQLLGSFAQYERAIIRERQAEGIAKAKQKGDVYKGGKSRHTPAEKLDIVRRATGEFAIKSAIAREAGISRETLYSYIKEASGLTPEKLALITGKSVA